MIIVFPTAPATSSTFCWKTFGTLSVLMRLQWPSISFSAVYQGGASPLDHIVLPNHTHVLSAYGQIIPS